MAEQTSLSVEVTQALHIADSSSSCVLRYKALQQLLPLSPV